MVFSVLPTVCTVSFGKLFNLSPLDMHYVNQIGFVELLCGVLACLSNFPLCQE